MVLIFIILYGAVIYFLINRYKTTEKKAELAMLPGEKEMLSNLATRQKKKAIFTILYMFVVIIAILIIFTITN